MELLAQIYCNMTFFKWIVHPKILLSLFTKSCMIFFFFNTMMVTSLWPSLTSIAWRKIQISWKTMRTRICLVTDIIQIIVFCL